MEHELSSLFRETAIHGHQGLKVELVPASAEHTTTSTIGDTDTVTDIDIEESATTEIVVDIDAEDTTDTVPAGKSLDQLFLENCQVFVTTDGTTYATIKINGHVEHHQLNSKTLRLYCKKFVYDQTGTIPTNQEIMRILERLELEAIFKPERVQVHLRIARVNNAIYVNLANANHEVVKIIAEGWQIISSEAALEDGVRFVRNNRMLPFPTPVPGGSLEFLKDYMRWANDADFILIVSWLLGAYQANGPYPILILQGAHGSGKSSLARILADLIDPSIIPLCTYPRSERDLAIAALRAHLLSYDNLSELSPQLADSLCRVSTGGGFATRQLYSDDGERIFIYARPVILNGISGLANRHDLTNRSIFITTTSIKNQDRQPESVMRTMWHRDRPLILGALFSAVSTALANGTTIELDAYPRMADFCHWVCCAESSLPWQAGRFLKAYEANRMEVVEEGLESDPVAVSVQVLMTGKNKWEGTPSALLQALTASTSDQIRRQTGWPKLPNKLSGDLRRSVTYLREKALDVQWVKSGDRKIIINRMFQATALPALAVAGDKTQPATKPNMEALVPSKAAVTENQEFEGGVI